MILVWGLDKARQGLSVRFDNFLNFYNKTLYLR